MYLHLEENSNVVYLLLQKIDFFLPKVDTHPFFDVLLFK